MASSVLSIDVRASVAQSQHNSCIGIIINYRRRLRSQIVATVVGNMRCLHSNYSGLYLNQQMMQLWVWLARLQMMIYHCSRPYDPLMTLSQLYLNRKRPRVFIVLMQLINQNIFCIYGIIVLKAKKWLPFMGVMFLNYIHSKAILEHETSM